MISAGKYNLYLSRFLTLAIALVWIVNGLFYKLLNFVPRHEEITSRILGSEYSESITKIIGVLEILMAVWIISGIKPKFCAITQIIIVAAMNILEFILVPELLLFGRINIIVAAIFVFIVYYNQFKLAKQNQSAA